MGKNAGRLIPGTFNRIETRDAHVVVGKNHDPHASPRVEGESPS